VSHYDLSAIDIAHAKLVEGLVVAHKPESVLEIGIGTGRATNAIIAGLLYNSQTCAYTVVDTWADFGDEGQPHGVDTTFTWPINFVTSSERDYVESCMEFYKEPPFDFIFSDGDHTAAEQWFEEVYYGMLKPQGILIYHDVNIIEPHFPNLRQLLFKCQSGMIAHRLFNKNSHQNERCQRGMLVIFKP
jgi:predicted O-methyltransferase YrrM